MAHNYEVLRRTLHKNRLLYVWKRQTGCGKQQYYKPYYTGKILPATAIPSLSKKQQTYCVFHALLFGQYGLQYS